MSTANGFVVKAEPLHPPLPLRHRLSNPPPLFVGRERELEALAAAVERSPVAVLCGPTGVGKTALALVALHRAPDFANERAVLIDLRPGEPVEDARLQIIRVLARALGIERVDWSDILRDDDALGGTLIDLAESGSFRILLDDLHHVEPAAALALLVLIARYARRSRWIVTSRRLPKAAEIMPQTISLGGLSDGALRQLATALTPGLSEAELQGAVAASGGSPWSLQQLLAAPEGGNTDDQLFGGLPEGSREFLVSLSAVDKALPLEVLGSFTTLPRREALGTLERRGLIQRGYGGYRLHDVVRRRLQASSPRALPSALDAARQLSTQRDPEALLEGARLLIHAGAIDELATMLMTCGERLIDEGFAPRLWQLVDLSHDARLGPWRLRCAVVLALPPLMAKVTPPADDDPDGRLLWARGLFIQGQTLAALELVAGLRADATPGTHARHAFGVGLLAVECLTRLMRDAEALAALATLAPVDAGTQALHESWLAYCHAINDCPREATREMRALSPRVDSLPLNVRNEVRINLAMASSVIGRLRDAYEISRAVLSSSLPSMKCLFTHFINALNMGHYDEAKHLVARLVPFVSERPPLRRLLASYDAYYRFYVGDLAGFEEMFSLLKPVMRREGEISWLRSLLRLEISYRMALGVPLSVSDDDAEAVDSRTALYARRASVRGGVPLPTSVEAHALPFTLEPREDSPAGEDAVTLDQLTVWMTGVEALVARGAPHEALRLCLGVLRVMRLSGGGGMEAEVRQVHCDILLVLGRWAELTRAVEELATLAATMPSPRYQGEARFFGAFVPSKPVDWGLLEQLASDLDCAPIAARRARFLLGESALLDAVDRRVLAALREHRGIAPAVRLRGDARAREGAGWGLEDHGQMVWRPDGTSFSLADRRQLWNLLVSLYDHGGTATKEQIAQDLWNESEYHPLRHDNRLYVAVRKLRRLLEDDPSQPTRFATTTGGYALLGAVRRARAAGP